MKAGKIFTMSIFVCLALELSACGGSAGGVAPTVGAVATSVAPTVVQIQPTIQAAATAVAPTVGAVQPTVEAAMTSLAPTVAALQPTVAAAGTSLAPTTSALLPTVMAGATNVAGMSPDQVVQNFYQMYLQLAANGNPLTNPQVAAQAGQFFTPTALTKLATAAAQGSDPVLCAQNLPQSFTVDPAVVNGSAATVPVHLKFGSSTSDVSVQLVQLQSDGPWLINDITCAPAP